MKKIVIVTMCCFFSCNSYKRTKFEYHFGKNIKTEWINNYKTEFFLDCMRYGLKNDTIFQKIYKKDLALLPGLANKQVDSIADNLIKNIPKPIYPLCEECNPEEESKKNYFCASCLNYYASRELDSIAKKAYKDHLKSEKLEKKFWENYKP